MASVCGCVGGRVGDRAAMHPSVWVKWPQSKRREEGRLGGPRWRTKARCCCYLLSSCDPHGIVPCPALPCPAFDPCCWCLSVMQIRFIGFNHVLSTELLLWNCMFVGLQVCCCCHQGSCVCVWGGTKPCAEHRDFVMELHVLGATGVLLLPLGLGGEGCRCVGHATRG